jgi:hypothetical protein
VVWNGRLLDERIARWRLTVPEVRAAIRRAGLAGIGEVQAAVLENDGEWSIVSRRDCGTDYSAFDTLDIPSPSDELRADAQSAVGSVETIMCVREASIIIGAACVVNSSAGSRTLRGTRDRATSFAWKRAIDSSLGISGEMPAPDRRSHCHKVGNDLDQTADPGVT